MRGFIRYFFLVRFGFEITEYVRAVRERVERDEAGLGGIRVGIGGV